MGSVDDQKLIVLRAALFDAAGADVDCLAPFKAFSALKLSDEETVTVAFSTGKTLPRERMKQCFNMSKAHMEGVYDSSEYGWDDDDKKSELKDASSRLLVATNAAGELVGFVAFIMTLQGELYEKPIGEPCMLVRDMQVAPAYQRRGVGRHLMRLCEMIGMKFQLGYVEALVTRDNAAAHAFFTSKAKGYSTEGRDFLDELDGDWDDDSFVVYSKCVSKALKHAAKIQAQQAKNTGDAESTEELCVVPIHVESEVEQRRRRHGEIEDIPAARKVLFRSRAHDLDEHLCREGKAEEVVQQLQHSRVLRRLAVVLGAHRDGVPHDEDVDHPLDTSWRRQLGCRFSLLVHILVLHERLKDDCKEQVHDEHRPEHDQEDVVEHGHGRVCRHREHVHLIHPSFKRDGLEDGHESPQAVVVR